MVGVVLGELRVTMARDAEAWGRCMMEERQQLWNEAEGDECVCGTWHQYGTHDGGWAAVAAVAAWLGYTGARIHQAWCARPADTTVYNRASGDPGARVTAVQLAGSGTQQIIQSWTPTSRLTRPQGIHSDSWASTTRGRKGVSFPGLTCGSTNGHWSLSPN